MNTLDILSVAQRYTIFGFRNILLPNSVYHIGLPIFRMRANFSGSWGIFHEAMSCNPICRNFKVRIAQPNHPIMEILSSYNLIIGASVIVILSFWFNGISKKTNIPSVLMLIVLGIGLQFGLKYFMGGDVDFEKSLRGTLEIIGTVGLIMIVLEAALELELKEEKTDAHP